MPMTENAKISGLFRQTDREEVIHTLNSEAFLYPKFHKLTGELREGMIDFLSGTKPCHSHMIHFSRNCSTRIFILTALRDLSAAF